MSNTPETTRPKSSAFSRYLFVLIFGLALGAIGSVMLMNAWKQRQDPFPDSVMHVQAWHMQQLGEKAKLNRCAATDTIPHLTALRTMAASSPILQRMAQDRFQPTKTILICHLAEPRLQHRA